MWHSALLHVQEVSYMAEKITDLSRGNLTKINSVDGRQSMQGDISISQTS